MLLHKPSNREVIVANSSVLLHTYHYTNLEPLLAAASSFVSTTQVIYIPANHTRKLFLQLLNKYFSHHCLHSSTMRNPCRLRTSVQAALALCAVAIASTNTTTDTTDDYPQPPAIVNYTTSEAGNPFVDGWYADPDTAICRCHILPDRLPFLICKDQGLYWIFPTSSLPYSNQTYLDAFSSPDLIYWTKHPNILTTAGITWATRAVWAPAPAFRNGKYYIYFGANDIQEGEPEQGLTGGIGVAVSDKPQGPYLDAIGKPLIGTYNNSAQPIDQDVFIDDDGQAYIYYGGHGHANVAKLNEDMISFSTFDDGTTFKEITPKDYVEGPQMLKRNGKYCA